jgi:5-methylcytosine-specific restriction enzyme A
MPWQAPRFKGPTSSAPRKAWVRPTPPPVERKRGRAGQRERAQVLAEEPLCRPCYAAGRTSASEQVDHIVPLAQGGSDDRENKQGICRPCHRKKSAAEAAAGRRRRGPLQP